MSSSSRNHAQPQQTPGNTNTSLRPRNKRLISGFEEPAPDFRPEALSSYTSTPLESPFHSRAASPIPSKHPSRSPSVNRLHRDQIFTTSPARGGEQLGNDLATSLSGLWGKSWTSLQGLASNVLGNDAAGESIKDKSPQRIRRPLEATHSQWGPQSREHSQPGAGSREQRKALVRERKRQELLMGGASTIAEHPQFKRRTSDDFESMSAPPGEHDDRDALVYVHQVKPQDTLAGLSIRFNCQLSILKKSNRMWSNDAIQTRTTIVLPVDACGVKGRPVSNPAVDQSDSTNEGSPRNRDNTPRSLQVEFSPVCRSDSRNTIRPNTYKAQDTDLNNTSEQSAVQSPAMKAAAEEQPWKHDSWVHLDGHLHAVEIARMPRRDLGFFPRARRKFVSYSDLDTPSASLDLPRPPSITISEASSITRGLGDHRKRGSSGASASSAWANKMSGPGGVGTLAGKGASAPGPVTDKFTKAVSKHLPNVAPPKDFHSDDDDDASQAGGSTGLESFLGATEGFVRKIAQTAAKVVEQPPRSGLGRGRGHRSGNIGPSGTGEDLIELSNAFEIGDEDLDDEDRLDEQRGRARMSEGRDRSQRATSRIEYQEGPKKKGD